LGYLLPVWPWYSQNTLPSRYSLTACVQGRDSSNIPLLRFDPPLRLKPEASVSSLSAEDNSHGIPCPFSVYKQRKSTSFCVSRRLPWPDQKTCQVLASRSHPANYGAALRFSQPLSDLTPLTAALPFSGRYHSWGCALQGFAPLTKPPATRRCRTALLTLLPPVALLQS
jgi:hypothetical protein